MSRTEPMTDPLFDNMPAWCVANRCRPAGTLLFAILQEIALDEDEQITLPFLHFGPGTPREDIYLWFEQSFGVTLGKNDLSEGLWME